jgi:hypothetical protein
MRAHEFINPVKTLLREYKRDVTVRQFGPQLVDRMNMGTIPDARYYIGADGKPVDTDEGFLESLFKYLEAGDPTYNPTTKQGGIYMPWITREFAKGNIRRIEDVLSRVRLTLEEYHQYKTRRDFAANNPLIKDIMRVDWKTLEKYVADYKPVYTEKDTGKYQKIFDDATVMVILPEDLQASKYWAQYGGCDTEWCTRFPDMFRKYTSDGPLYIIIPKQPHHEGEKYQYHPKTSQLMDEEDSPIGVNEIFNLRFPALKDVFIKINPELTQLIVFASPETVEKIWEKVGEVVLEKLHDSISGWEQDDEEYMDWVRDNAEQLGYINDDGDIDWNKVHDNPKLDYLKFNDTARRMIIDTEAIKDYDFKRIIQCVDKLEDAEQEPPTIREIPKVWQAEIEAETNITDSMGEYYTSKIVVHEIDSGYLNYLRGIRRFYRIAEIDGYVIGELGDHIG